MEEENDKQADPNACTSDADNSNQENANETSDNNEAIVDFQNRLHNLYKVRVYYMELINQTPKRKINWAMFFTQLFGRYSNKQIVIFLSAAIVLAVIQVLFSHFGFSSWLILALGALLAAVTLVFTCITLNNVLSALKDVRLLKKGFCTIGYQVVLIDDIKKTPDHSYPEKVTIAYKDSANMIRTLEIESKQNGSYFDPSVLLLFLDYKDPYSVAFFDTMPLEISYENKIQSFIQDWYGVLYTLVPVTMTVLFTISFYLSYIAYTTLNQ